MYYGNMYLDRLDQTMERGKNMAVYDEALAHRIFREDSNALEKAFKTAKGSVFGSVSSEKEILEQRAEKVSCFGSVGCVSAFSCAYVVSVSTGKSGWDCLEFSWYAISGIRRCYCKRNPVCVCEPILESLVYR